MSRRLGLIIGINQYADTTFRPLQFAENDARALAQWLVNVKGGKWSPADVQLVQGEYATHELIESLITQMCVNVAESDDLVLIYFAGHAFLDEQNGEGSLALSNTYYRESRTALHLSSILNRIMAQSRARHIVFILDCFQTGQLWSMRRTSPYDMQPLLTRINSVQPQEDRFFLCSCRGNELLPEGGEQNLGLFMHRVIVGLCGSANHSKTENITLRDLYTYLSRVVNQQQRPYIVGRERYPFALVGGMTPIPAQQRTTSFSNPQTPPPSPRDMPNAATQVRTETLQYATTTTDLPPLPTTSRLLDPPYPQSQQSTSHKSKSFLIAAAIQTIGFVIGLVGTLIPIFQPDLIAVALLLESIGMATLCVNAARGSYRHGFTRLVLTFVQCVVAASTLGLAYLNYNKIITEVQIHPGWLVPLLFLGVWLAVAATLPLLLAIGGVIVRRQYHPALSTRDSHSISNSPKDPFPRS